MISNFSTSVQVQSRLLKQWEPRMLLIDGQKVSILDKGVVKTSFDFTSGTISALTPNYQLEIKPTKGKKIIISVSNQLVHTQLLAILTAAASSATLMHNKLLGVAEMVCSTATTVPSCGVTASEVLEHLKAKKNLYDRLKTFETPCDVYSFLLDLEATYVSNYRDFIKSNATQPHCLAHTVYQLHPLLYSLGTNPSKPPREMLPEMVAVCVNCKRELPNHQKWRIFLQQYDGHCDHCGEYQTATSYYKTRHETTAFDIPLRQVLGQCPHRGCTYRFGLNEMYRIHILDEAVECPRCNNSILYETFQIAMFIHQYPTIDYKTQMRENGAVECRFQSPTTIPKDGLWSTYSGMLQEAIRAFAPKGDMEGIARFCDVAHSAMIEMYSQPSGAFAVDLVQGMYHQLDFITKVGTIIDYWSQPQVIAAAIQRYEQFVYLHKKNSKLYGVPTMDISLVWQTHLTKRSDYLKYSSEVTKRVLPYFDVVTPTDIDNEYLKTSVAWSKFYKQPYSSFVPETMTPLSMEKAGAIVSQGESRFFGVDELVLSSDMNMDLPSGDEKAMVSVIGRPSFDDRVHIKESKQDILLTETYGKEHKRSAAKSLCNCALGQGGALSF
ncbi:hypothetical protein THRCLA_10381 [Thraustotheca clavata]|uniref:Uncharacterized protein n=1 Tax=Thraustotheca clavata TaxID=74557 RepID=A0A1V9YRM7_9STRA|nr:hypothetical protein THRCLA_10381 [Thraustotheca clavata]